MRSPEIWYSSRRPTRRWRVALVAVAAFVATVAPALHVAAADPPALPPRLDESVERGLAFLAKGQQPDGSFADDPEYRIPETALAVLAYLSAGHAPEAGRYGLAVRGAVDFLVAAVPEDGYVGRIGKGQMYAQGIVTLALAQAHGVEPSAERRLKQGKALGRLVALILKAQAAKPEGVHAGGWRYTPEAQDSDLSLSGWNALALRAAQDVGVKVPADAIARAADYVERCYSKEAKAFAYQPSGPVRPGANGTGVLCLYLLDRADRPAVRDALKYLVENAAAGGTEYEYYAVYYATHAAFQVGDETWSAVSKVTLDRLIKSQKSDGGWPADPPRAEPGRVYRTAMAVLTLTVPYRLLPIYQR